MPVKLPKNGEAAEVSNALQRAGLLPEGCSWFPPHWSEGVDGEGYLVGVRSGRVRVRQAGTEDCMWFDTIEEADAWVLACWRMR